MIFIFLSSSNSLLLLARNLLARARAFLSIGVLRPSGLGKGSSVADVRFKKLTSSCFPVISRCILKGSNLTFKPLLLLLHSPSSNHIYISTCACVQHHQRIRPAAERWAQSVPRPSAHTVTQGSLTDCVSPSGELSSFYFIVMCAELVSIRAHRELVCSLVTSLISSRTNHHAGCGRTQTLYRTRVVWV